MKTIPILIMTVALLSAPAVRAQDAATEERINKLTGQIEDLLAARTEQNKRISEMGREIETLREQAAKPNGSYASQEDLRRFAEKLAEVEKNREHDKDVILKEIAKLGKVVATPVVPAAVPKKSAPAAQNDPPVANNDKPGPPEKGFDYVIKSGDTLSVIVQAYRQQDIKVTVDQIRKANPGLKPESLKIGQKIFIPAPQT